MEFDCGFERVCALMMAGGLMSHRWQQVASGEADRQTDSAGGYQGVSGKAKDMWIGLLCIRADSDMASTAYYSNNIYMNIQLTTQFI